MDPWTPLLLPVGHYLGPVDVAPDALARAHLVRIGGRARRLPGGDEYLIWVLTHGVARGPQPWTPADIATASALPPARFDQAVAGLVGRGLLVVVDPDGTEAESMARSYRWQSMLCGHGMRPEWNGRFGIGPPDEPWALVNGVVHDVWRWAPVAATMWDACEALALAYREPASDDDPAVDGPHEMLGYLLSSVQLLLSCYAGFVEEAW